MKKSKRTPVSRQDAFFPRDTKRSLPIALLRAREAVMEQFRPMLAAHGITEQQWRVVRILAEHGQHGPVDASKVADEAFILAPSLTRILRTLDKRGLIKRGKDKSDGRRVLLEITSRGLAVIEEVAPESRKIYEDIEKRFGRKKLDLLLTMLDDLTRARQQ